MATTSPLFRTQDIQDAINTLSFAGVEERGAIFTKREVVDFILDLAGYSDKNDLSQTILLEPSFGDGDFLLVAIERLLNSLSKGNKLKNLEKLRTQIRAVELHTDTFNKTKRKVVDLLQSFGIDKNNAESISSEWLVNDDFLLTGISQKFTHIIGNPPYVRQEMVPQVLMSEYRQRYKTIFDRADLYIPFIEKGLDLLMENGSLGYICSDRWTKSRYGGPLRKMISKDFSLRYYVDMAGLPAFHTEVSAYAAVTVIVNNKNSTTRIAAKPKIEKAYLDSLVKKLVDENYSDDEVKSLNNVTKHDFPWLLNGDDQSILVESLEKRFPTLDEEGCKIGIGVATGCDRVYISDIKQLPVEESRKLPLVTTGDIADGFVKWSGKAVVNPFEEDGTLVDLKKYPKLSRYFSTHKEALQKRNVAKKNAKSWYKTIDKITKSLASTPKLLIPDIKLTLNVVYDEGKYYPHHNLYYVVSDRWNIRALQTILKSSVAQFFIAAYSTKMRGDYLRFQAQHLRRIRIPQWDTLSARLKRSLEEMADSSDLSAINKLAYEAYSLTAPECAILDETLNTLPKA